jgi:hypothetical protein
VPLQLCDTRITFNASRAIATRQGDSTLSVPGGDMAAKKQDVQPRRRGRPKGSTRRAMTDMLSMRISAEYGTWLGEMAAHVNGDISDVIREGVKLLAQERKFRPPPLK